MDSYESQKKCSKESLCVCEDDAFRNMRCTEKEGRIFHASLSSSHDNQPMGQIIKESCPTLAHAPCLEPIEPSKALVTHTALSVTSPVIASGRAWASQFC